MSFANSNPPASASNSIFNIFSKTGSKSSSTATDSSSASSNVSPVSSLFPEEVKKTYTQSSLSSNTNSSESESEPTSFMGYFIRFILVVVLLGFAGFNVFKEMGLITDDVLEFTRPFMEWSTGVLGSISKQFVSTTSEGTRTGIDIVSGAAKTGVNIIDDQVTSRGLTNNDDVSVVPSSGGGTAKQEAARATALTMKTGSQLTHDTPLPDESLSVTQKGKTSGKAGYCFVGEDRGIRSCAYVNESDTCMSGNIFPSKDKCINPNLRV